MEQQAKFITDELLSKFKAGMKGPKDEREYLQDIDFEEKRAEDFEVDIECEGNQ